MPHGAGTCQPARGSDVSGRGDGLLAGDGRGLHLRRPRAIGFVEACGRPRGVTYPFQGTIATTDGDRLWVFRYSSEGKSRSLFFSRDARTVKQQYRDMPGAWAELPEASYGVVGTGDDQLLPFIPKTRLDPPRIEKICQPWARCPSRERGCESGLVKIFTSCEDRSTPLRMGPAS